MGIMDMVYLTCDFEFWKGVSELCWKLQLNIRLCRVSTGCLNYLLIKCQHYKRWSKGAVGNPLKVFQVNIELAKFFWGLEIM